MLVVLIWTTFHAIVKMHRIWLESVELHFIKIQTIVITRYAAICTILVFQNLDGCSNV